MKPACRIAAAAVLAVGLTGPPGAALETDQYYAWGRDLPDASAVISAKLQLELERAIDGFERPPDGCTEIAVELRKRLRFILFHHIQLWTMNTTLVPRVPADGAEEVHYREVNLYHRHGPLDVGTWMPTVPTIEVGDVRIGTDKLSHFVSSGWTLYGSYRRALAEGLTPGEAERTAVRRGLLEESLILGGMTSGLVSLSDLEAGTQGMRFYRDLCGGPDPLVERGDDGWALRRPVDIRRYVTPEWDESYQPPVYRSWRWRKVKPVLEGYCDRLGDPSVVARRRRYRERDTVTAVEEVVSRLVAEGRIPDPWQFSIEAVCGRPVRGDWGSPPVESDTSLWGAPPLPELLTAAIVDREEEVRPHRIAVVGVGWAYPEVAAASLGLLSAPLPAGTACRTSCDLWGGFVQVQAGLGGGRVSAGYGRVIGEMGEGGRSLVDVFLALGVKGTVLRTWRDDISRAPANQTYVGPELEFSVARVNFGLGVLRRVDGSAGRRWLVVGGLGWGF